MNNNSIKIIQDWETEVFCEDEHWVQDIKAGTLFEFEPILGSYRIWNGDYEVDAFLSDRNKGILWIFSEDYAT